jgi:hypothetical protein
MRRRKQDKVLIKINLKRKKRKEKLRKYRKIDKYSKKIMYS